MTEFLQHLLNRPVWQQHSLILLGITLIALSTNFLYLSTDQTIINQLQQMQKKQLGLQQQFIQYPDYQTMLRQIAQLTSGQQPTNLNQIEAELIDGLSQSQCQLLTIDYIQDYLWQLELAGSYAQLRQFIHLINQSTNLLLIETLEISRDQPTSLLRLKIRIQLYHRQQ